MSKKKNIIQVFGPTGIGKTRISIEIAKEFNCEIISADSMQVYKDFNIGTDKISEDKKQGIKHHLIDIINDCSQFNASKFLNLSFEISEKIIKNNKTPLVCGGTPFYHRVIHRGIFPEKTKTNKIREELKHRVEHEGINKFWEELNKIDPIYANKIGESDKIRIIRGLEIFYTNNIIPTEIFKLTETPFKEYNFIRIGLNTDRSILYKRINERVDQMITKGLVEEVKNLLNKYKRNCPPFNSLGYKEILMVLNDEIDLNEGIELIKQHSRNFAKRQLSWFRGEKDVKWFEPTDKKQILEYCKKQIENRKNRFDRTHQN